MSENMFQRLRSEALPQIPAGASEEVTFLTGREMEIERLEKKLQEAQGSDWRVAQMITERLDKLHKGG